MQRSTIRNIVFMITSPIWLLTFFIHYGIRKGIALSILFSETVEEN